MILVIDNYDSFVYNLVQYVGELGGEPMVVRNDAVRIDDVRALAPSHIVLSPGPRTPNEAGICLELVEQLGSEVPILGVCLGHQAIGQVHGARVVRAPAVMHGMTSQIYHSATGIHSGLPDPFVAMRYHSLTLDPDSIPEALHVRARTATGEVMGIQHVAHPTVGVQYHPESIATEFGHTILRNFLDRTFVALP